MYLTIVLIVISFFVYIWMSWNNNYWKRRNVPHETPTFLLGNFKEVITGSKHIAIKYFELYNKYKNYPYVGYFKLTKPAVIVRDPELIKDVLIKDFSSFADNDFRVDQENDIFGSNAFIQTGEKWSKTRKSWSQGMTAVKLKAMFDTIDDKTKVLVEYLKQYIKERGDEPFEPRILCAKFFTDVTAEAVFGTKLNTFENPDNKFFSISTSSFKSTYYDCVITLIILLMPSLVKLFKIKTVPTETEEQLYSISRDILKSREKTGFQKNTTLDSILLDKMADSTQGITERDAAIAIHAFLLDATETSSGVAGFALHTLAEHPEVQEKLRQEIDSTLTENGGVLTHDIIHKMPYLDMVLSETLRMHPPFLNFQRLCTKTYKFPPPSPRADPVTIPKGMTVIIPAYALHYDPEYYPEPEKFIPERFSEENKPNLHKHTYMPFGDGPRICLGFRHGINQLKILLVALIRHFEVKLAPHMVGNPIIIDPYVLVKRNIEDFAVTFHERRE